MFASKSIHISGTKIMAKGGLSNINLRYRLFTCVLIVAFRTTACQGMYFWNQCFSHGLTVGNRQDVVVVFLHKVSHLELHFILEIQQVSILVEDKCSL